MEYITTFLEALLELFAEMAPFLLLGFLLAGILHVWVPRSLYVPKISKPNFKSVLLSALFGIPLPICSCGVIPTAVALRKEGASKGASVSFLISTPATGVDSILATYSLLGLPFAILRPVAAFVSSMFGGILTNVVTRGEAKEDLSKIEVPKESCGCGSCGCGHDHDDDCCEHEGHCCDDDDHCNDECCHEEKHGCCCCNHEHDDHCCEEHRCGCRCDHDDHKHDEHASEHSHGFVGKLKETFAYGFGDLLPEITRWLLVGLVLGALTAAFVPNELLTTMGEYPILCMFTMLLISMPMYTCSTGSIPLALALMAKGLPPGAALVLLMAGPATSIASMVVVGKTFGKRTLAAYLFSIAAGAFLFGWLVDTFMMDTFLSSITMKGAACHGEGLNWFDYGCAAVLSLLILYGLIPKKKSKCC
ncbi:MAG: SO_0444 family Cu/Zn efflux transporter [Fibrobacter sp.]|nr:SO_0444 family Cu/Zn efflux transporter [Fibrobacter sp.]